MPNEQFEYSKHPRCWRQVAAMFIYIGQSVQGRTGARALWRPGYPIKKAWLLRLPLKRKERKKKLYLCERKSSSLPTFLASFRDFAVQDYEPDFSRLVLYILWQHLHFPDLTFFQNLNYFSGHLWQPCLVTKQNRSEIWWQNNSLSFNQAWNPYSSLIFS